MKFLYVFYQIVILLFQHALAYFIMYVCIIISSVWLNSTIENRENKQQNSWINSVRIVFFIFETLVL